MERWACVDVPALPLQLLLLRQPSWIAAPTVVVDVDRPQGRVVWVNRAARDRLVRPGMRYAAALAIEPELRAGVLDPTECEGAVEAITRRLRAFSPAIEPSADEPGVFWLDASGLTGVFASLDEWAERIVVDLRDEVGWIAAVVVGHARFSTYALARRLQRGARVYASASEEQRAADRVGLDLLQIDAKLRTALDRLGVRDVGALRALPAGGLLERFGKAGARLQRFVHADRAAGGSDAVVAAPVYEPIVERLELDPGDTPLDAAALVEAIGVRLTAMCRVLAKRGAALRALHVRIVLDDAGTHDTVVQPATPSLDVVQMLELVRLRVAGPQLALSAPIVGFELRVDEARASRAQLELFTEQPRRDLAAANRALARVRAEFGDGSVVRPVLREAHLPEGAFVWQPLPELGSARPRPDRRACLVRRLLAKPFELHRDRQEPDGWYAAGLAGGPVRRAFGPYVISGGWWSRRRELCRHYWFIETERGDLLWVYRCGGTTSRGWRLQGAID